MTFRMHWVKTLRNPADSELISAARLALDTDLLHWCHCNGYVVLDRAWLFAERTMTPDTVQLVLEATVGARWDGVWGDLRHELALDGLLPDRDRPEPSRPLEPPDVWWPPGEVCAAPRVLSAGDTVTWRTTVTISEV